MLRVYLKRQKVVKQKTVKKFIEELRPLQAEKPLLSIGERGNKGSILADGFAVIHEYYRYIFSSFLGEYFLFLQRTVK